MVENLLVLGQGLGAVTQLLIRGAQRSRWCSRNLWPLRRAEHVELTRSEHHDRDPTISLAQIRVCLQSRLRLEQSPGLCIGGRPVLSENAGTDLTLVLQFSQPLLDCDADVSARAART